MTWYSQGFAVDPAGSTVVLSAASRNGVTVPLYADQAGTSPVTLPTTLTGPRVTYWIADEGAVYLSMTETDGTDLSQSALCTCRVIPTVAPAPSYTQVAQDVTALPATYDRRTVISLADAAYGVAGDARTITDAAMSAASTALTSAAAGSGWPGWTAADVGKTVVVNYAGAVLTATTSSLLGTGAPITSLPVSALAAAIPAGGFTLTSGGNTQSMVTTGAAQGATALPLVSITPNFAYPSGSAVTLAPAPMKTTIAAWVSAGQVTLTAAATTAVAGVEATFGTNNLTGIQAAINDAIKAGWPLFIPPVAEGYLYDGLLAAASSVDIQGSGARELWGTATASLNTLNLPAVAPYLAGSVLIQAAQNTDGLQFTGVGNSPRLADFGIRFAGKFRDTGGGFVINPPALGGQQDHGMLSGKWSGLRVYGHDGNHYAYSIMNCMYSTFDSIHSYGGGGLEYNQNSSVCSYGNAVFIHPYSVVMTAGTAHGMSWRNRTATGGQKLNLGVMLRPQSWVYSMNPILANVTPPSANQKTYTVADSVGVVQNVALLAPDFEQTATGGANAQVGTYGELGQIVAGGTVGSTTAQSFGGSTLSTTYKNSTGASLLWIVTVDLTSAVGASATASLYLSKVSGFSPSYIQAEETIPAGVAQTIRRTMTCIIQAGQYGQIQGTNATVVRAQYAGVTGSAQ